MTNLDADLRRQLEVRDATRRDLEAIVVLLAADDIGVHVDSADVPLAEDYHKAFHAIADDPNHRLAVAVDAGEVIGTLHLMFLPHLIDRGGWRAQLEAVFVAEERRGQGVGARMMQWAVTEARRRECHLVQLTSNKQRRDARRFYESLGFEATHEGLKLRLSAR